MAGPIRERNRKELNDTFWYHDRNEAFLDVEASIVSVIITKEFLITKILIQEWVKIFVIFSYVLVWDANITRPKHLKP